MNFASPITPQRRDRQPRLTISVSRVRTEAMGLAWDAINSVQASFRHQGYELKRCGLLLASGKPLPDLPQILASRMH